MTTSTIQQGEGIKMTKKYQKKEHTPKKLRKYRLDHGYTIYSLADRMGVSYSSVSYWENGEKFPRHDKIMQLEEIFGVGYSELFKDMTSDEIKEIEIRKQDSQPTEER
jgi:transcriptional regulator with XRE-family HTH domain